VRSVNKAPVVYLDADIVARDPLVLVDGFLLDGGLAELLAGEPLDLQWVGFSRDPELFPELGDQASTRGTVAIGTPDWEREGERAVSLDVWRRKANLATSPVSTRRLTVNPPKRLQLTRSPAARLQLTRSPAARLQLPRSPDARLQLTRSPDARLQLTRSPDARLRLTRSPAQRLQLTRTPAQRLQLTRNPAKWPQLTRLQIIR
jgi:hypothetical protein